jgi:hypothetical protein
LPIAIILRENLVEIPKKYKTEAPYCLTLCVNRNVVSRSKTKRQERKGVRLCPAMIYFYLSPGWFSSNKCKTCLQRCAVLHTDKKENKIFLIYNVIQMGSGESYIYEEGLPNI